MCHCFRNCFKLNSNPSLKNDIQTSSYILIVAFTLQNFTSSFCNVFFHSLFRKNVLCKKDLPVNYLQLYNKSQHLTFSKLCISASYLFSLHSYLFIELSFHFSKQFLVQQQYYNIRYDNFVNIHNIFISCLMFINLYTIHNAPLLFLFIGRCKNPRFGFHFIQSLSTGFWYE